MYTSDPFEVIRPRKIQPAPKIDPRLLAFAQEGNGAGRGHTAGKPERAHMPRNVCRYVNGRHACYATGDFCPVADSREILPEGEQPIVFRPMRHR